MTSPSGAMIRKVCRQPSSATSSGTAMAPAAPPRVRPVLDRPCGRAQRPGGNQRTTAVLITGKTGACVTPTRNRTSISEPITTTAEEVPLPGTRLVTRVRITHRINSQVSTRRGPRRSPSTPPGNWKIV
jgi:hypothetical protein